ncbi:2-phosphosulfolactate phosphatase [Tundrisphaera lichenicola]|uniref:2-phosphosulfolactate phosphatase n=1 Tax=Tundrisphaera lichenicola TaxID=2029860 RepID=UPI003EB6AFCD
MSHRPSVFAHLLPGLIPSGALEGGVAVVIDILRATTTMIHALAAGCESIIPCLEIEEARQLFGRYPLGKAILAGERSGLPIEGFDLGNSPSSFTPARCSGKSVVMTTSNGTRAIMASMKADRVLIGSFVNRQATIQALKADGRPIHLICAGTEGEISLEDSIFAGSIADEMDAWGWDRAGTADEGRMIASPLANDQAEIAAALWRETEAMMDEGASLAEALADGRGGRRILEIDLQEDLEDAAQIDRFSFAAELLRDPTRIVPATDGSGPRLRLFNAGD